MKLNRFQGRIRSGVVKEEPWSPPFYCPCQTIILNIPQGPLPNPQHLSHFTTLMVVSRLAWQAHCSASSETASRHLWVLSSVIFCIYFFNLFVCNLLQLITGVFALSQWEYLYGRNTCKDIYKWDIFNYQSCFQSVLSPWSCSFFWQWTNFSQLVVEENN